jgi:broad specificity phosphatase PhoE
MSRSINLYFVRHGYATHNEGYDLYGEIAYFDEKYRDSLLTIKGKEQADNLQTVFQNIKIDLVYSSPLRRCIETMERALPTYNDIVYLDDRLIEALCEHPCNKRHDKEEIKSIKKLNLDKISKNIIWSENPETFDDIRIRANNWYIDLINNLKNNDKIQNIAIFSHCEFLHVLFTSNILPIPIQSKYIDFKNCEIRMIQLNL